MAVTPIKKPASPAKTKETGRSKFLRLAEPRVQRAVNRINLIGNLGGSSYESTEEERGQVITALFDAVHEVKRRLEHQKAEKQRFTFKK